jgi:hypothetical protein
VAALAVVAEPAVASSERLSPSATPAFTLAEGQYPHVTTRTGIGADVVPT